MSLEGILKQCILENTENRELQSNTTLGMPPLRYKREFQTIWLDVGRQTGKTIAIISMYREGDLIVVRNQSSKTLFPAHIEGVLVNILTAQELSPHMTHPRGQRTSKRNIVWVDEPTALTSTSLDLLYAVTDASMYILLGSPAY